MMDSISLRNSYVLIKLSLQRLCVVGLLMMENDTVRKWIRAEWTIDDLLICFSAACLAVVVNDAFLLQPLRIVHHRRTGEILLSTQHYCRPLAGSRYCLASQLHVSR